MPNALVLSKIVDGNNYGVYNYTLVGDGSGEESATVLLDASELTGDGYIMELLEVTGNLTGFSATLLWQATTPVVALQLPEGNSLNCMKDAPIRNGLASGAVGDLSITTVGLGNGDKGSIRITVRKAHA